MRKAYAIILLIPFLTLFAGSVTLASSCAKMAAGCGERAMAAQKCTMTATHQGCRKCMDNGRQKCHKGQTGKEEQKNKGGGSCCMDCPLCCLITFKSFFRWDIDRQSTIIDYTVISDHNLSDYFQQHWKPPGGSFFPDFQQTFFTVKFIHNEIIDERGMYWPVGIEHDSLCRQRKEQDSGKESTGYTDLWPKLHAPLSPYLPSGLLPEKILKLIF